MRFPEFSGEWKETTIGECCSELEYGMNAPSKYFDGVNKYIRITDIDEQTSEYKQDSVVSPDALLEDKYIVKDRDILFARTGASTGKTYIYNPLDGKMYYAGFLIRANVKMEDNPKFVFYQTQTYRYKKWVSIMSMRSGQPGINSQEYASYKFWKPCKDEQDKISALISLLDTRIQTQKKIIEKYESLIRGISNKLLYEFEGASVRLGDILIERSERTQINNQHEVLSSTVKGIFSQREYFSKDIASENNVGYKIIRLHDVVLSPQNLWMGNINYNDKFDIGIVSPSYKIFSIADGYDKRFVAGLLKTHRALYNYMQVSEQGASIVRRNLNMEAFAQLVFKMPPLCKQHKIGNAISVLSSRLGIANKIKLDLELQKDWLLREMFI